ncbi:unnamed protein product [Cylicocyclus nassatus]|uniref:Uncharacterized protein n=1 Tax=Cylicocyclus nassatus TaxID=53992 RepID=A0AA36HGK1_CYLNA|nr:unnamed protein product [Cylicocyclus nassatus]
MESAERNSRGRSAELDGRRINAVSPMHLSESKMLQSLWKEHQQQQEQQQMQQASSTAGSTDNRAHVKGDDGDRKLQMMLEKYQSQVKLQQQRAPTSLQTKTQSRNNINKIENHGVASVSVAPSPGRSHPMSHSQPCLIAISDKPPDYSASHVHQSVTQFSNRISSGFTSCEQHEGQSSSNGIQRVPNNQKLIQSLREENLHLKREIEASKKKLVKLQQMEAAYERIEKDYENLLREKERQEGVEKSALVQMEMHLKRVISEKEALQDRLEQFSLPNAQAMEKVNQLNMVLAEIIPQNKELAAVKERQRLELEAQNATLEEQRTHISMLEKALSNAQERLAKREKVCDELTLAAERANHLQRLLHETLLDKQARDETHAQERTQWEMDMTQLKMQLNKDFSQNGSLKRISRLTGDAGDETINRLKKTMYAKDERITQLERTVVELQRRLHEETERKNCALGAFNDNFEAKMKQFEEEKAKDRRITLLGEDRGKLGEILDVANKDRDDDAALGMHKMEEIRQKIQERKRKGRICATGGLIGMGVDHSRSSSGSLLPAGPHLRTSSGPFEQTILDSAALLSEISNPYANRPSVSTGYHNFFQTEKREGTDGDNVWNV